MPDEPVPFRRPINWNNLRSDEAERLIRERSKETKRVQIIGHPEDRSETRDILLPDVFRILREGQVVDPPVKNENGDWEAVIRRRMRGTRDAGVATIVLREDKLIVKTVMWID